MRKGHSFEKQVAKILDTVNAMGYHAHKNHPMRKHDGTYLVGEPFDYEIIIPGYIACFDAKETHTRSLPIREKEIYQAEHLKHCKNAGADAFFLVYFHPLKKKLKIDVDHVMEVLQGGGKSVGYLFGSEWDIAGILSEAGRASSERP